MNLYLESMIYVVGDDVSTDAIIPKENLVDLANIGRYAMQGLDRHEHPESMVQSDGVPKYRILVAGNNLGCGELRKEAAIALSQAGVEVIVAESYNQDFYDSCRNNGKPLPLVSNRRMQYLHTGEKLLVKIHKDIVKLCCRYHCDEGMAEVEIGNVDELPQPLCGAANQS